MNRLQLIEKSAAMKLEELSRRADEKSKQINDINKKLDPHQAPSPQKLGRESIDDARSEFSAITNESEMRNDENILDFAIEDAEFYVDAFDQVPSGSQL